MHALLKMYVKVPREQHFRFFSFSIVVFSILKSSMPTLQYNYYSPRDFFWIIFRVVVDQVLVPYDSIVKAEVKVLITTTVMFCAELRHRRIQGKCFPFEVIRWHSTQCECAVEELKLRTGMPSKIMQTSMFFPFAENIARSRKAEVFIERPAIKTNLATGKRWPCPGQRGPARRGPIGPPTRRAIRSLVGLRSTDNELVIPPQVSGYCLPSYVTNPVILRKFQGEKESQISRDSWTQQLYFKKSCRGKC